MEVRVVLVLCVVLCCGQRLSAWMEGALLIRCELFFQVPRSCSEDTGNRRGFQATCTKKGTLFGVHSVRQKDYIPNFCQFRID